MLFGAVYWDNLGILCPLPLVFDQNTTLSHSHFFQWLIISLLSLVSSLFDANKPSNPELAATLPSNPWHFGEV